MCSVGHRWVQLSMVGYSLPWASTACLRCVLLVMCGYSVLCEGNCCYWWGQSVMVVHSLFSGCIEACADFF